MFKKYEFIEWINIIQSGYTKLSKYLSKNHNSFAKIKDAVLDKIFEYYFKTITSYRYSLDIYHVDKVCKLSIQLLNLYWNAIIAQSTE